MEEEKEEPPSDSLDGIKPDRGGTTFIITLPAT